MSSAREKKPDESEFLPYYGKYIAMVPEGDIIATLEAQARDSKAFLSGVGAAVSTYRYAPGKWSVKEILGHVIDSERVFAARALTFARGDSARLPGFEQDDYVRTAGSDTFPLPELAAELEAVRRSTVFLFRHLPEDAWLRRGVANDAEVSVRALAYIIAGHELHHWEVLRTRYL
jgi:hypothetical protein